MQAKIDKIANIDSIMPDFICQEEELLEIVPKQKIDQDNIKNIIIADSAGAIENIELLYEEAVMGLEGAFYKKAIAVKFDIIESHGLWTIEPRKNQHLIDSRSVFTKKVGENQTKYQACLCARSFKDNNYYDLTNTYSPTAKLSTVHLLLALSLEFEWGNKHLDVSSAFLYREITKEVYMKVPRGMQVDGQKMSSSLKERLKTVAKQ